MQENIRQGSAELLGCQPLERNGQAGFNFAIYSSQAQKVELCLFCKGKEYRFPMYQTGAIWHIWLASAKVGMQYGFRITPKANEKTDFRCEQHRLKVMLDPYAREVLGKPDLSTAEKRQAFLLSNDMDNAHLAPKAVICAKDSFSWEQDEAPNIPWGESVFYELHVKGFSQLRTDIPEPLRGTYAGLAHPNSIAYLQQLGITAVELLPVQYHLDEVHLQEKGLKNYWGYNPLAMFALETDYCADKNAGINEFKAMVKALHKAGIEVILDMVFNHSAESEQGYPTFCQRGIDDATYYWHNAEGQYINDTGCGNMLNVSTDIGRRWVMDCLRFWVQECHVDGFRFDLGTTLGRETPAFNAKAKLFREMAQEPCFKNIKFIAEPWDIGLGGYQVGQFPPMFAEWNDRFRDDMTRFWLWKSGELGTFAQRFAGSSDIYQQAEKYPHHSVNFITAHDGFTLRDLCSYNQKHNEANGEDNRDGRNENHSYNHGVEGSMLGDESVQQARFESSCGLLASLLLANGTPMLLAGDEFAHSQQGNNNAYCQDNPITWLNWQNFQQDLYQLCQRAIALRKQIPSLQKDAWWTEDNVRWLNVQGTAMTAEDWHNHATKAFQIQLDDDWLILVNAKAQAQLFLLPQGIWTSELPIKEQEVSDEMILKHLGLSVLKRTF